MKFYLTFAEDISSLRADRDRLIAAFNILHFSFCVSPYFTEIPHSRTLRKRDQGRSRYNGVLRNLCMGKHLC